MPIKSLKKSDVIIFKKKKDRYFHSTLKSMHELKKISCEINDTQ
jgi:hypothetical protein